MDHTPRWLWHLWGVVGVFTALAGRTITLGLVLVAVAALALWLKDGDG